MGYDEDGQMSDFFAINIDVHAFSTTINIYICEIYYYIKVFI